MDSAFTHHEAVIDGVHLVARKDTVATRTKGSREALRIEKDGDEIGVLPFGVHATPAMLEEGMRTVLRMKQFTTDPER